MPYDPSDATGRGGYDRLDQGSAGDAADVKRRERAEKAIAQVHAIRTFNAAETGDLAFMGHRLVQVTLPHEDPGDVTAWGRENGDLSLVVQPGMYLKAGEMVSRGIPFGVYPRLVLTWITTEAVRTKNRRLVLGGSLTAFMNELGVTQGGKTTALLREQMTRLFAASIRFNDVGEGKDRSRRLDVVDEHDLWWNPRRPDEELLFQSTIRLTEGFFHEITERPVPVDMRALQVLKASPLGLDLYTWLTYRVSYMKRETVIPWKALEAQLGTEYARTKDFTQKAKRELKRIKLVWPQLEYRTPRGRLVLKPCRPHVRPKLKP